MEGAIADSVWAGAQPTVEHPASSRAVNSITLQRKQIDISIGGLLIRT
jgi:hypothetical protein